MADLGDFLNDGLGKPDIADPCNWTANLQRIQEFPPKRVGHLTEEEFQALMRRYEERNPSGSRQLECVICKSLPGTGQCTGECYLDEKELNEKATNFAKKMLQIHDDDPDEAFEPDEDEQWASALALFDKLNWMMKAILEVEDLSAEGQMELAKLQADTQQFLSHYEPSEI
jgi:hypothetical protein